MFLYAHDFILEGAFNLSASNISASPLNFRIENPSAALRKDSIYYPLLE